MYKSISYNMPLYNYIVESSIEVVGGTVKEGMLPS